MNANCDNGEKSVEEDVDLFTKSVKDKCYFRSLKCPISFET